MDFRHRCVYHDILNDMIKEKGANMKEENTLEHLRTELNSVNDEILDLLLKRGHIVEEIGAVKQKAGLPPYDPEREEKMLMNIKQKDTAPYQPIHVQRIFKTIFDASKEIQDINRKKILLVSRQNQASDTHVKVNGTVIGNGARTMIFGPCAVESYEQMDKVGALLSQKGETFIRGGAFKPRTSPYDFQGLGEEGLKILKDVGKKYNLNTVSEIVDTRHVELAHEYLDVFQVGARNAQNFELLKEIGKTEKPVLFKRGMSMTISEYIHAAEYIAANGNNNIILCERGIRTFEKETRNTLDISAVPILKQQTHLPVIVDITHSTGRKDIMAHITKAAIAVGSDGLMCEIHPTPSVALSDASQQLDFDEFEVLYQLIK